LLKRIFIYSEILLRHVLEKLNALGLLSTKRCREGKPENVLRIEIDIRFTRILFHINSALDGTIYPANHIYLVASSVIMTCS
jgi:hypothetical protein